MDKVDNQKNKPHILKQIEQMCDNVKKDIDFLFYQIKIFLEKLNLPIEKQNIEQKYQELKENQDDIISDEEKYIIPKSFKSDQLNQFEHDTDQLKQESIYDDSIKMNISNLQIRQLITNNKDDANQNYNKTDNKTEDIDSDFKIQNHNKNNSIDSQILKQQNKKDFIDQIKNLKFNLNCEPSELKSINKIITKDINIKSQRFKKRQKKGDVCKNFRYKESNLQTNLFILNEMQYPHLQVFNADKLEQEKILMEINKFYNYNFK